MCCIDIKQLHWCCRRDRCMFSFQMPSHSFSECSGKGPPSKISPNTPMRSERKHSHTTMRSWYPMGVTERTHASQGCRKVSRNIKPSANSPQVDFDHTTCDLMLQSVENMTLEKCLMCMKNGSSKVSRVSAAGRCQIHFQCLLYLVMRTSYISYSWQQKYKKNT